MTNYEDIARVRLVVDNTKPRGEVRERLTFLGSLFLVICGVWLFACFFLSFA